MDTTYLEILEAGRLLRERKISVRELVAAQVERIERLDPRLHAFARTSPEKALARAASLDAELATGRDRGPLHGIPLALKDLFWEREERTAAGTVVHKNFVAAEDATVIVRLKEAGAVLVGSVQLTEGAYAMHHPSVVPPVNPWNSSYWSGASSSGSGVAVAGGLCFGSVGTETGGSIHLPSAANGVTGLKPTWGRVSRHGVFELAATLDHVGPLARSAADAAVLLTAIAGYDAADPTSSRSPVPDYSADLRVDLRGVRIGLDERFAFDGVDEATCASLREAIHVLVELGAEIVAIKFPPVEGMVADWFPMCAVQTALAHAQTYPSRKAEYGDALASLIELGRGMSATDFQAVILRRLAFAGRVDTALSDVDMLVLPVMTFSEATLDRMAILDDALIMGVHRFTCAFTMSGHPAITLPCGFTAAGTPLTFQFVGQKFAEAALLGAAHAYQNATALHRRHPDL